MQVMNGEEEDVPAAHGVHMEPSVGEKWLAEHASHAVRAVRGALLCCPAGHAVHAPTPDGEWNPGAHEVHTFWALRS